MTCHDSREKSWNVGRIIGAILNQSEPFKLLIDLEHYQEVDLCGFSWIWARLIQIIGGSWRRKAAAGGGHWSREMRPIVIDLAWIWSRIDWYTVIWVGYLETNFISASKASKMIHTWQRREGRQPLNFDYFEVWIGARCKLLDFVALSWVL